VLRTSAIPGNAEEWRKSLLSKLLAGEELIVFDNATGRIESGAWAHAVTADTYCDRLLGLSKDAQPPVRCTWGITGNALEFGGDMIRRNYRILMDAGVEHPENREATEFKHPLPEWAMDHQPDLLRACLILCRRWWAGGQPNPRTVTGDFPEWKRIVGGVLQHSGIEGFLSDLAEFRASADVERGEWFALIEAMRAEFGQAEFTVTELMKGFRISSTLRESLPEALYEEWLERQGSFSIRMGLALRQRAGQRFGNLKIEGLGRDSHTRKPRYRVLTAEPEHPGI
jgi:hypothetical protein